MHMKSCFLQYLKCDVNLVSSINTIYAYIAVLNWHVTFYF